MSRTLAGRPYERDVIKHAAGAAKNHAQAVGQALSEYVAAIEETSVQSATDHLYRALVAQSVGHEPSAANGSTHSARVADATAALAAWNRTGPVRS